VLLVPRNVIAAISLMLTLITTTARSGVIEYGNENLLGTGTYPTDPKAGATLSGLATGVVTDATNSFGHGYPFTPAVGDFAGTDQIYVGSVQTAFHDGYSQFSGRINGPQVLKMDYSSLLSPGQTVGTLTLGIAADDFQQAVFGQPFTASINGVVNSALTSKLASLNETGPVVHFFTIGIAPNALLASNVLTLTINEGGDGGDGWAVDFLTIGVTAAASSVPEPSPLILSAAAVAIGCGGCVMARRGKCSKQVDSTECRDRLQAVAG
jgi:hypothetical protein